MKSYSAQILRSVRKSLKINQVEISKLLKLSQGAISKIENGLLEFHALEWINFCREFDIDPNVLTQGFVTFLPQIIQKHTKGELRVGSFKVPGKYSTGDLGNVHAIFPILRSMLEDNASFEQFRAEAKESMGIDPDYFLVLDHPVNALFFEDFFKLKTIKALKVDFTAAENFIYFNKSKGIKAVLETIDSKNIETAINTYIKNFAKDLFVFNKYELDSKSKTIRILPKANKTNTVGAKFHDYQLSLLTDFLKLSHDSKYLKVTNKKDVHLIQYA